MYSMAQLLEQIPETGPSRLRTPTSSLPPLSTGAPATTTPAAPASSLSITSLPAANQPWAPTAPPAWLGPGAYSKWSTSDPEYDPNDPKISNDWWRGPSIGGGLIYNPDKYGWQEKSAVKDWYLKNPTGDFNTMGLTPQMEQDWRKYYPNAQTDAEIAAQSTTLPGPITPKPGTTPVLETIPEVATPTLPEMSPEEIMAMYGYTGELPLNEFEQQYLNYIKQEGGGEEFQQTMYPAQNFLADLVSGAYAPQGQAFAKYVYDPTREEAMRNYEDMSKRLAEGFSQAGGYYGGKSGVAQGRLAAETSSSLNQILANLNLQGYQSDIANRLSGAGQLPGLATTQKGIESTTLANILSGGNLITGREATNRAELQSAEERAYNDWVRARTEALTPFQYSLGLMGMQPTQPIAQQPATSPWSYLLGGLGTGLGTAGSMYGTSKLAGKSY